MTKKARVIEVRISFVFALLWDDRDYSDSSMQRSGSHGRHHEQSSGPKRLDNEALTANVLGNFQDMYINLFCDFFYHYQKLFEERKDAFTMWGHVCNSEYF